MVEGGRHCVDILTQLQAARAALARVEREILDDHVGARVSAAAASGDVDATREKKTELTELLSAPCAYLATDKHGIAAIAEPFRSSATSRERRSSLRPVS